MTNDWERKFGRARRAADKRIPENLERQIAREERSVPSANNPITRGTTAAGNFVDLNDASRRIARAFGRPLT
jgi:hypothetical protein